MHTVTLAPATTEELDAVDRWLQHPGILQWLGSYTTGTDLARMTRHPDDLRKLYLARVERLVVRDTPHSGNAPVAYVSAAVYGVQQSDHETGTTEYTAPFHAVLLYAVRPDRQQQRIGTALIPAVLAYPGLASVETFSAGIARKNVGSQIVAMAAGFIADPYAPADQTLVYRYRRPAACPMPR
ncbi:GNAT family N-acetyltransferase [Nocardia sp. NPDC055049]